MRRIKAAKKGIIVRAIIGIFFALAVAIETFIGNNKIGEALWLTLFVSFEMLIFVFIWRAIQFVPLAVFAKWWFDKKGYYWQSILVHFLVFLILYAICSPAFYLDISRLLQAITIEIVSLYITFIWEKRTIEFR